MQAHRISSPRTAASPSTLTPTTSTTVAKALEDKGYKFDSAQIEMVPQTYQKLDKQEDRDNMEKMLDLFEEDDDVQNVWHNWDQEE